MSIEDLKELATIGEVLAHFGAVIPRGGGWNDWQPIDCPFCSDTNGSASVNQAAGYFICHQCGAPDRAGDKAGDIIDVVKFGENIRDTNEAVRWIEQTFL